MFKLPTKMKKLLLLVLMTIIITTNAFAQSGIAGKVIDKETGEELIGVAVVIDGTTTGAVTDLSGDYLISVEPGVYTLNFSYIGYSNFKVSGIKVEANKMTKIDAPMGTENVQLNEVVVEAKQLNDNEFTMLRLQKNADNVQDGISSSEISRSGAGNAAESIKSITGASIQDNKFVVIRGLGDRYSITSLNGVTMPSSDPYRNSTSMDLIPSSMIESIVTTKTFTPDQPGHFTGGNVNIATKSLPEKFYLNAGISIGYNERSSFQTIVTDPTSGSFDALGYDDGSRALPSQLESASNRQLLASSSNYILAQINSPENATRINLWNDVAKNGFKNSLNPSTATSAIDHSVNVSFGNRKNLSENGIFGYSFGLNYGKNYDNYVNRPNNIWKYIDGSEGVTSLNDVQQLNFNQSNISTRTGAIANFAYQYKRNNEYSLGYVFNNVGDIKAMDGLGRYPEVLSGGGTFYANSINFQQRGMHNVVFKGENANLAGTTWKLNYNLGYTRAYQNDPDLRMAAYDFTNNNYLITEGSYSAPGHFFRELTDDQISGQVDLNIPFLTEKNKTNAFKFGLNARSKSRDFSEEIFTVRRAGVTESGIFNTLGEVGGNLDLYTAPSNSGIIGFDPDRNENITGLFYQTNSSPKNRYEGREGVYAAYAMATYNVIPQLKLIGGVRLEQTDYEVESGDKSRGTIEGIDLLPALNAIYALNTKSNLRFSVSQTVARPNMREMAPFGSFGFIGDYTTFGNPNLKRTSIQNVDLRYEIYLKPGEIIAASVFYKNFQNPIVNDVLITGSAPQITWVNSNDATLYGVELEYRKNIIQNLSAGVNFTYTFSQVDLGDEEYENGKKVNPDLKRTRPFQAQSPYLANLFVTYNTDSLFEASLSANVFGRRQKVNGVSGTPDQYEIFGNNENDVPTPMVNFSLSYKAVKNYVFSLNINNILDGSYVTNQEFRGTYFLNERYYPGRVYSVSVKYLIK